MYKKIIEHFGKENQIDKLVDEEMQEFRQAIILYALNPSRSLIDNVIDELNDLTVLVKQLAISEGYEYVEISDKMYGGQLMKVDRTVKIIDEMKLTGKSYEEIRKKY